jgi:hypothetical protein
VARPSREKPHVGFGQRAFAIAPRNLLDYDCTAAAAVHASHGIQKEHEESPQRDELKTSFCELIVPASWLMAARADRRRSLARSHRYFDTLLVRTEPCVIVDKSDQGKTLSDSLIHILGVAYKSDIDDVRESPALDIIHLLRQRGASITYSDPHVPELRAGPALMTAVPMRPAAAEADCAVVITAHSPFDYVSLAREAALIVDNPQRARRDGSW